MDVGFWVLFNDTFSHLLRCSHFELTEHWNDHTMGRTGRGIAAGDASADIRGRRTGTSSRGLGSTTVRRTLKNRLAKLEKQSASPKVEVLWVDVDRGETHEGVLKARYGDQVPPDVEPITVSWMPQA